MIEREVESASPAELRAYLQGTLKDGTYNQRHRTHRIGQADNSWLRTLQLILKRLGVSAWIYREGATRKFWVLETAAPFLSATYDGSNLVGTASGISYARGYFDAEGGMPRSATARLYLQYVQKNRASLHVLTRILETA